LELWLFAGVETIAALRAGILHFTEAKLGSYSTWEVAVTLVVGDGLRLDYDMRA
jgi:hypothetical protein